MLACPDNSKAVSGSTNDCLVKRKKAAVFWLSGYDFRKEHEYFIVHGKEVSFSSN